MCGGFQRELSIVWCQSQAWRHKSDWKWLAASHSSLIDAKMLPRKAIIINDKLDTRNSSKKQQAVV